MANENKFENAQELCERLYTWCTAQFRAGFSIRINGGTYSDMTEHSDWRDGKSVGWESADKLISEGKIFFVYPFKCERSSCPTRFQYGGFWACNSCNTHIDTPEWWKIKVIKDGNQYCCIGTGFINLQESDNYGFGNTFNDAIEDYRQKMISPKSNLHPLFEKILKPFTTK